MASVWKDKVLPKITGVFSSGKKKAAAAEVVKSHDESKEEIGKELEEKKTELGPKVIEIYEASPAPIKDLVKKPTDSGLKKNSAAVKKFLEELAKIDFPGSKAVSEAATKFGTSYVTGPITFIFEKVASLLPEEPPAAAEETTSKEVTAEVIEEIKTEEAEKVELETPPPPATETPAPAEPAEVVAEATPPPPAPTSTPEPEPANPAEAEAEAAKA